VRRPIKPSAQLNHRSARSKGCATRRTSLWPVRTRWHAGVN